MLEEKHTRACGEWVGLLKQLGNLQIPKYVLLFSSWCLCCIWRLRGKSGASKMQTKISSGTRVFEKQESCLRRRVCLKYVASLPINTFAK